MLDELEKKLERRLGPGYRVILYSVELAGRGHVWETDGLKIVAVNLKRVEEGKELDEFIAEVKRTLGEHAPESLGNKRSEPKRGRQKGVSSRAKADLTKKKGRGKIRKRRTGGRKKAKGKENRGEHGN